MSEQWNRLYTGSKAQSLLELAIFGSLLIMLIGVLINYGLRYNFQQEVTQEAFRKALASAADSTLPNTPTSVTHVIIKDKHIPDPTNPFAIGSVQPVSSQAAVTRSWRLDETADNEKEVPIMRIEIQGKPYDFRVAGIRDVNNVDSDAIKKYKEIYGANNVWVTAAECKIMPAYINCDNKDDCAEMMAKGDSLCTEWEITNLAILDPMGSLSTEISICTECTTSTVVSVSCGSCDMYRNCTCDYEWRESCQCNQCISCEGEQDFITYNVPACSGTCKSWITKAAEPIAGREIIDYGTGVRICRQIVDKEVCRAECEKGRLPDSEEEEEKEEDKCDTICAKEIPLPWYCEYTSEAGEGIAKKYTFKRLDELFSGFKSMGVQPGYTKTTRMDSEIIKSEDTSGITTTDKVDWQDKTVREIKYYNPTADKVETEEASSDVIQKKEKEWKAEW